MPVATPAALTANLGRGSRSYVYDATAMTWTIYFWYGVVSGVAKCSTIEPENIARGRNSGGLIPSDQDAIESAANSGQYCYCKMTEPLVSGSPWVFVDNLSGDSNCAVGCAGSCVFEIMAYPALRASVFAAAVN